MGLDNVVCVGDIDMNIIHAAMLVTNQLYDLRDKEYRRISKGVLGGKAKSLVSCEIRGGKKMAEWLEEVEALTLKGQIAVPYKWWVGETGSLFLKNLCNDKKIVGSKCKSCGVVFVPPRKNCGRCFVDIDKDSQIECSNEGVVEAYTIIRRDHPVYPIKAPFAQALIRLDNADVSIVHLIEKDLEKLENGARVVAEFKDDSQRKGEILDIKCFRIIESAKGEI